MNTRQLRLFAVAVLILVAATVQLSAQDASVSYLEGEPELRRSDGSTEWLDYGGFASPGESIITGSFDYVELSQGDEATIRIQSDTIYTVREVNRGGRRETVLSTAAGSVSFRFNRLSGREPRIGTETAVAGVRGTEVTVYSGPDGSSLFLVESGLVEVSSGGESVELAENEGVEVPVGRAPGEKFSIIGREIDFSSWSAGRIDDFLSDPVAALDRIEIQLQSFSRDADEWYERAEAAEAVSDAAREELGKIEGAEEQAKYREETWLPLVEQTSAAVLNYRYNALSALSLRRYSLSSLYMEMKSRNILDPAPEYGEFVARYNELREKFGGMFDEYLEDTDL